MTGEARRYTDIKNRLFLIALASANSGASNRDNVEGSGTEEGDELIDIDPVFCDSSVN